MDIDVTVELHPIADGHTRLVLSHEQLPVEHAESHEQGWGTFIEVLKQQVKTSD